MLHYSLIIFSSVRESLSMMLLRVWTGTCIVSWAWLSTGWCWDSYGECPISLTCVGCDCWICCCYPWSTCAGLWVEWSVRYQTWCPFALPLWIISALVVWLGRPDLFWSWSMPDSDWPFCLWGPIELLGSSLISSPCGYNRRFGSVDNRDSPLLSVEGPGMDCARALLVMTLGE